MSRDLFLRTISYLRFPLILLVVMIHAELTGEYAVAADYPAYALLFSLVSIVTASAVPLFFLFSGYLFFHNAEDFSAATYRQKVGRRVKTLLIPYLFWNAVVLLRFWLTQTFAPGYADASVKPLADYTFLDWLRAFWDGYGGNPVCFQFWFLRDLMVLVLLTPLLYGIHKVRYGALILLAVLALLCLWGVPSCPGFNPSSVFYFSLGAFGALKDKDMAAIAQRFRIPALALVLCYAVYTVIALKTARRLPSLPDGMLAFLCTFSVVLAILGFVSRAVDKRGLQPRTFLKDSAFFIYAAHPLLLSPIKKAALGQLPHNDFSAILVYLAAPTLTVLLLLALFWLLKRLVPRFLSVITGGRY